MLLIEALELILHKCLCLNQDIAGSVSPISNMKQCLRSKTNSGYFNYSGTSVIPKPKK
jgi:hypothetical protein